MTLTSTSESSIQVTSPGNSSPSYFTITHSPIVKFSAGSWGWASSSVGESCSVVEMVGGVTLVLRIQQTRKLFSISSEESATLTSSAPEAWIQWTLCVWGTAIAPPIWHPEMQIVDQSHSWQWIQLECLGKAVWRVLNTLAEWSSLQPNVSWNCPLHHSSNPVYDTFSMRCGRLIEMSWSAPSSVDLKRGTSV